MSDLSCIIYTFDSKALSFICSYCIQIESHEGWYPEGDRADHHEERIMEDCHNNSELFDTHVTLPDYNFSENNSEILCKEKAESFN